jgi:hypothetical protein
MMMLSRVIECVLYSISPSFAYIDVHVTLGRVVIHIIADIVEEQ